MGTMAARAAFAIASVDGERVSLEYEMASTTTTTPAPPALPHPEPLTFCQKAGGGLQTGPACFIGQTRCCFMTTYFGGPWRCCGQ